MKKIQLSWGIKIIIVYISFMALILTMVFKCMNQKVDLVSKDYYAQELKFQNKIDGINNVSKLSAAIKVTLEENHLFIQFPAEFNDQKTTGEIWIYRPSDSSMDMKIPVSLNENAMQSINGAGLKKGVYKIQITCTNQGKKYYSEHSVYVYK